MKELTDDEVFGNTPKKGELSDAEVFGAAVPTQQTTDTQAVPVNVEQKPLSLSQEIPRQLGLTGRHVLEGVGDLADLIASPIRAGLNAAGMNIQGRSGKDLSDIIGLPEPRNATERVVGDVSRLVASSAGGVGLAGKLAQGATGATQGVFKAISARPDLQLASATGAGAAGGVVRESGGGPLEQAVAAIAGGVASPVALSGAQKAVNAARTFSERGTPEVAGKIESVIDEAVKPYGMTLADISESVKSQLREDMAKAVRSGSMSPDVVRRLVDYRLTGLTPTAGPLTLDPGIVTRQKNLSALGVSSQDPKLQQLASIENANARKLIENMNALGAGTADDAVAAGQKVIGAVSARNTAEQSKIGTLYDAARDSSGRSALLDGKGFVSHVNTTLKEQYGKHWGEFVPKWLKDNLDDISKGEPLTVDDANILKTLIGNETKSATGNTRYALGAIRRVLDDAPVIGDRGKAALEASNTARAANRSWMQTVEETPALEAIRSGVEPDKFVNSFIIGGGNTASINSVVKLRNLIKDSPEAMTAVKNNIMQTLKGSLLSGKADEVGRISSSSYNKTLNAIGDAKLRMFLSPEEFQAVKAIGRVASYEQFQPTGSAVNNSRTAAAVVANVLDSIGGNILSAKLSAGVLPGMARMVSGPIRNASASSEAAAMTRIPTNALQKPANDRMFLLPPILAPLMLENQ